MSPGKGALCKNFDSKHLKNKLKHKKYWFWHYEVYVVCRRDTNISMLTS